MEKRTEGEDQGMKLKIMAAGWPGGVGVVVVVVVGGGGGLLTATEVISSICGDSQKL